MKKIFAAALPAMALVGLLLTGSSLSISPVSKGVAWNGPFMLAANTNGEMAVVNDRLHSITILDRAGRVTGTVESGISDSQFRRPLDVAVTDDAVYVADARDTGSGNALNGVRIVRYGFNGEYRGVAYEEEFDEVRDADEGLNGFCSHNGRLYAMGIKDGMGTIYEFTDGEKRALGLTQSAKSRVHTLHIEPQKKLTVLSFDEGETYLVREFDVSNAMRCAEMDYLQCFDIGPDGTHYWSCRTANAIMCWRPGETAARKLADVRADRLLALGGRLYFTDFPRTGLGVCDVKTGAVTELDRAPYAPAVLSRSRFAWLSLAILAFTVLFALVRIVATALRRRHTAKTAVPADPDAPIGMSELYTGNLTLALIIFAIVTSTLSIDYFNDLKKAKIEGARHTAELIARLTPDAIGDDLAKMRTDGRGTAARRVEKFLRTICSQDADRGNDLGCSVARFESNGVTRCLLTLERQNFAPGDVLPLDNERVLHRSEVERRAERGELTEYTISGYGTCAVPLRDRTGTVRGIAYLRNNATNTLAQLKERIFNLSIDLLSQLLVLVMIFGECLLLAKFLAKRRADRAAGLPTGTMCEAQRPIRIIQYVISASFLAFLPEIAGKSAAAAGLSGELMTTLPIVALMVGFYVGRMFLQDVCSRSPRRSIEIGCAGMLAFAALMAAFARGGGYWVLVAAMFVQALAMSVVDCACMSLRACGLEPDRKFRLLVFTNMEPAIGSGVGVALGAFLYAKLGIAWVSGANLLLTLAIVAISSVFVHRDIDASALAANGTAEAGAAPQVSLGATLKFCLSPFILAIVLCVTMPVGIISSFESYALPVFNEQSGNSVVLVGFVLVVAKFVTLFLLPRVFDWTDRVGNVTGLTVGVSAILAAVLLFAFAPGMMTMVAVVLVFGFVDAVMTTCAERQEVEAAERAGVPYDAAAKFLVVGEAFAYSAGAPIFCALLAGGWSALGFSVFFAALALFVIFLLIARRQKTRA